MSEEGSQKEVFKDEETQKWLNQPVKNEAGFSAEDEDFLNMLINLINEGKIELYKPSSLLNGGVYESSNDELKGHADMEAMQMLATIREIKTLCDNGYRDTKQVENLVYSLRISKERFESDKGDLFII